MPYRDPRLISLLACIAQISLSSAAWGQVSIAQDAPRTTMAIGPELDAPRGEREEVPVPKAVEEHPLVPAIQYARTRYDYIRRQVRDFTCILVKRERIGGRLRSHEYVSTRARFPVVQGGQVVTPFSVYMHFLAPAKYKGRKVLYVEGQNEGKMLVRNGGKRFSYITVRVAPGSDAAMGESRYPITELGLENVTRRLIEKAEEDMKYDPTGENTEVNFYRDARVGDRTCTHVRVVHPRRDANLSFHIANVFVDDELHVPIRVEGYDWPDEETEEPPLLEEYTFTKLRLNVGLSATHFDESLVAK